MEIAVENAPEDYRDNLVSLHARFENTAYRNDPDLGRLTVKMNQMRYPELFS